MEERNSRTAMLIGTDALDVLKKSRVAIFGLGGVGGHAAEAIVRAGVGTVDIIDNDTVSESNINRQLIATYETVGLFKTDAFESRIKSINPDCCVNKHTVFFDSETKDKFDFSSYDYVVDAIDSVQGKILLAVMCSDAGVPLISAMGAGNKLDPTAFEVADIYETSVCPLARVMRSELKRRGIKSLKVVYSKEVAKKPILPAGNEQDSQTPRKPTPASISFVPSVSGLIIASEVIKDLIKGEKTT
jgi:tRNA A37 threonylcarbamoyladenosine dehydratase